MAVVVAGGLAYATLMTLFIVPVMYDILYRRTPRQVDVGDDLDDVPDDAAEYLEQRALEEHAAAPDPSDEAGKPEETHRPDEQDESEH